MCDADGGPKERVLGVVSRSRTTPLTFSARHDTCSLSGPMLGANSFLN